MRNIIIFLLLIIIGIFVYIYITPEDPNIFIEKQMIKFAITDNSNYDSIILFANKISKSKEPLVIFQSNYYMALGLNKKVQKYLETNKPTQDICNREEFIIFINEINSAKSYINYAKDNFNNIKSNFTIVKTNDWDFKLNNLERNINLNIYYFNLICN